MARLSVINLAGLFLSSLVSAMPLEGDAARSVVARSNGDVAATWTGSDWTVPVTLGSTQTLPVVLDTGSCTL
jgi:hypothetical protein